MSEITDFVEYILKSDKKLTYLSQGSFIGLLIFILYLEISPKLGNVWFRYSAEGIKTIQPDSLANFLRQPFKDTLFWKPDNWDLNFITFSGLFGIAYSIMMHGINYSKEA